MPQVTFIQSDGSEQIVDGKNGQSLMELARDNDVDGILAECGGACACATCHVIIETGNDKLPSAEELELAMLAGALNVTDTSRLACQIQVDDTLDGLRVRVPDSQF